MDGWHECGDKLVQRLNVTASTRYEAARYNIDKEGEDRVSGYLLHSWHAHSLWPPASES